MIIKKKLMLYFICLIFQLKKAKIYVFSEIIQNTRCVTNWTDYKIQPKTIQNRWWPTTRTSKTRAKDTFFYRKKTHLCRLTLH